MYVVLNSMSTKLLGFKYMKALYANDSNFAKIYNACGHSTSDKFYLMNGYLFKKNRLCVFASSLHELFIRREHEGGLTSHFGVVKTLDILHKHFYWYKIKMDM